MFKQVYGGHWESASDGLRDRFKKRAKEDLLYIKSQGGVLQVHYTGNMDRGECTVIEPLIKEDEICPTCGGNITKRWYGEVSVNDDKRIDKTCSSCGMHRNQLLDWLSEPLVFKYGMRFRSESHQKALDLIDKCSECKEAIGNIGG
jgi:RNA polymerase subunit RPABC4/transcription elongation factor Spt4